MWTLLRLFCLALLCCAFASPVLGELTPLETLGKLIFFDTNLSTPPGQACAACHAPDVGFTGPVSDINAHGAVYPGAVHTRFGNRKPPASAYVAFSPEFHYDEGEGIYIGGMFWDGRAPNTVEQAKGPFLNPLEQNNPNAKVVVDKVRHSDYSTLFQEIFGWGSFHDVPSAYQHIAEAIAAYEASEEVDLFSSKYDLYLAGEVSLAPEEMHGLELFEGRGNCAACHPSRPSEDGTPPLFTDYTYDNLGTPKNPENPFYGMPPHFNPDGEDWVDYGLGGVLGLPEEMGKMKVPTLRNVDKSPYEGFAHAYMHNGVFKGLHEVIDFYNTRDVGSWPPPEVPENVNTDELGNLGLTDSEVDDIVAFLRTLTDGYVPEGAPLPTPPLANQTVVEPTSPTADVRFVLAEPSQVDLKVFDVKGRLVRTLIAGEQRGAGTLRLQWDGTDRTGATVVPGIYFYRLRTGSRVETHRVVRLR